MGEKLKELAEKISGGDREPQNPPTAFFNAARAVLSDNPEEVRISDAAEYLKFYQGEVEDNTLNEFEDVVKKKNRELND